MEASSAMLAALDAGVGTGDTASLHGEVWSGLQTGNGRGGALVSALVVLCGARILDIERIRGGRGSRTCRSSGQFQFQTGRRGDASSSHCKSR